MATTVTDANLTVTITDSVTLNGQAYGNTNTLTVASIDEVYQRVITVPTTSYTTLFELAAANAAGTLVAANTKYFRITNLDDTNDAYLKIADAASASESFVVKVNPGKSFIMGGVSFQADSSDLGASPTWEDTMEIQAVAVTAAVDLEVFVASV
jgi:hypothetical protein